ncbi:transcriptional regulator [Mycobacteriaceae bacterium 1482268.1]|nr:transcriptional regulator [Mycobacteriaceae bacterium 1482268.1]
MLGVGGARGLSHPKLDVHAGVPPGTASFYFRTRQALLLGIAERVTELDVQDLSRLTELATDGSGQFTGTAGLAELVMYSGAEPYLTRTKARYELVLHASRDAQLMSTLRLSVDTFYRLAHDVVTRWHRETDAPPADLIDEQARAVLALVNGVMLSFVAGQPIVQSGAQLEHLLDGLIAGLTANRGP